NASISVPPGRVSGVPANSRRSLRVRGVPRWPIVIRDAPLPLPRGVPEGTAFSAARLPIRLPRRSQVEAQVRAIEQPAHLRAQLRGLPALPVRETARGFHDHALHGLTCPVCSAPALPLDGACIFCHAPMSEEEDTSELLEFLVARIPTAKA